MLCYDSRLITTQDWSGSHLNWNMTVWLSLLFATVLPVAPTDEAAPASQDSETCTSVAENHLLDFETNAVIQIYEVKAKWGQLTSLSVIGLTGILSPVSSTEVIQISGSVWLHLQVDSQTLSPGFHSQGDRLLGTLLAWCWDGSEYVSGWIWCVNTERLWSGDT